MDGVILHHVDFESDFDAYCRDGPDPGRDFGPDLDPVLFYHHLYDVFSKNAGFLQELVSVSLSAEPLFNNFSVVRLSGTTFLVRATRATRQKEKLLSAGFSFSFILFSFFIFQVRTERLLI